MPLFKYNANILEKTFGGVCILGMETKISVAGAEFSAIKVELSKAPLLLIKGKNGFLACGYINIQTANKLGETAAIVSGVKTFDDMLAAKIRLLSEKAQTLGLDENATGADFLKKLA